MDTDSIQGIMRAVQGVRLIGAEVVLTGIRPDVARTLVALDAGLDGVVTFGSLQDGIAHAIKNDGAPRRTPSLRR
jgi:rsbT co-antagonist protein RsbR